jgi:hypothetical protein
LKEVVDSIDKVITVLTGLRDEPRPEDTNGRIIVTCYDTLAIGDIVSSSKSMALEKNGVETSKFAAVRVTLFEGARYTMDSLNIG